MDHVDVNVGQIIVNQIEETTHERSRSLFFPSLITRLCYDARVLKHTIDINQGPNVPMYPFNKKGPKYKSKKRKSDVDFSIFRKFTRSTYETTDGFGHRIPLDHSIMALISYTIYLVRA